MNLTPLSLLRTLPPADAHADGEYLRRYTETGDEAAFAELVRRNGPLVLRACRTILRDPTAADDAFQVTFLLLARHAARLTGSSSVAGWLHTVAVRSAAKIRRTELRRRKRERPAPEMAAPVADSTSWAEVRERIDAALAALPEKYQVPLLLCYIQGLHHTDAAQRIGCTTGALRGRLERGRELLRRRLQRWGLPAFLVLAGSAPPVVGTELQHTTLAAVRAIAPTAARAAAVWVKWAVAAVLAVAAAVGIGFAALRGPTEPPQPERQPPPAAPPVVVERTDAVGDPLPPGALARMGSSRFHHGSNIHRLTVSPDGKWIISSDPYSGARVWDLATGKEQVPVGMPSDSRFVGPGARNKPVQWEATIAPAGKRIVAVVPDRNKPVTRLLDVVTGDEVATVSASLRHVLRRYADDGEALDGEIELSADGRWMMWTHTTGQNNSRKLTVYIADLTAKEPTPSAFAEFTWPDLPFFRIRFSADGNTVLFQLGETWEVWDRASRTAKFKPPVKRRPRGLGDAVLSGDGKMLAIMEPAGGTFQLWDVSSRKQLPPVTDPFVIPRDDSSVVNLLAFSPDGRQVVASSSVGGLLRVWDVATGKKLRDYETVGWVWAAAFTPDGKRLAVATYDDVRVLDLATGKPVHDFGGHDEGVHFVTFASNDRLLTCGASGFAWNPRTGRKLGGFKDVSGLATALDGRLIATSDWEQTVRLRNASTLEEVLAITTKESARQALAFTPDGKELVIGGEEPGIRVYDRETGRQKRVIARGETADWVRVTAGGKRVVFGRYWSTKTTVHVWDFGADRSLVTFDAGKDRIFTPAVSSDGRWFAVGDFYGSARVFDLSSGKQLREIDTNFPDTVERHSNIVWAVAFSPDGRSLATCNERGAVRVWELATGGERFRLDGHRGSVTALAYSPDGTTLASGSNDRSVITWDATGMSLPVERKHRPKNAVDAWVRLTDPDAAAGFGAIRYLTAQPAETLELFGKQLHPISAADPKAVAALVEKLGSAEFADREAAEKELAAVGDGAVDQLRAAATTAESAEVRQRIARLLAPAGSIALVGDRLRAVRAVEVVERIGSADARKLLREWASGARTALLTQAARSALARLGEARLPTR